MAKQDIDSGTRWMKWLMPIAMLVFLVFFARFALFSDEELFRGVEQGMRGRTAVEVVYHATGRFFWVLGCLLGFAVFFFLTLRQWSLYYLHRKLFLYYMLGMIPFLTTILIFAYGVRTYFGLANTLNIEKVLEVASRELGGLVGNIEEQIQALPLHQITTPAVLRKVVEQSLLNQAGKRKYLEENRLDITIFYLTAKAPNIPRSLIQMYPESSLGFISGETEAFEEIIPNWLTSKEFTDVIEKDNRLFLHHFSQSDFSDGSSFVILAMIPIDRNFLNLLKEFQPVKIYMTTSEGTFLATDSPGGGWYWSLLLRPLSSKWDLKSLDWRTGYYRKFGNLVFEIEPAEIIATMTQQGSIHIFHREEKSLVMKLIITFTLILAIMQFLIIVFGLYLVSYITRSMTVFAEGHESISTGNLNYRLPYLGRDQLGAMARSFNSMVGNIESLLRQVLEQEKFKEELRIARDIQMSLLPDLDGLAWCDNISAACIPAREVGGDYYEVLQVDTGEMGVFIADVSGKGTSAAFYMAELKGVLLALRHLWADPRELLMAMNQILKRALRANIFISAAYLLLNPSTKTGKLGRAGHCPAFHVKENGELLDLAPPGIAIGIAKNDVFGKILKVAEFPMEWGDKIILYTDGLDEMTFHREMYGLDRLKAILSEHAHRSVIQLKKKILEDVLSFLSSGEQNDDLTLVVAGLSRKDEPSLTAAGKEVEDQTGVTASQS